MKYISITPLIAALFIFCGCTSTELISSGALEPTGENIRSVVLTDTTIIEFYEATFNSQLDLLTGRDDSGKEISVLLKDITELRSSPAKPVNPDTLGDRFVSEVLFRDNSLVIFNPPGGRYDSTIKMFNGATDKGYRRIRLSDLKAAYCELPDTISISNLDTNTIIRQIIVENSNMYTFGKDGGRFVPGSSYITGSAPQGTMIIDSRKVLYALVEKTNMIESMLAFIGIAAMVGVIMLGFILWGSFI